MARLAVPVVAVGCQTVCRLLGARLRLLGKETLVEAIMALQERLSLLAVAVVQETGAAKSLLIM
jgi:hypothetical protein